MSSLEQVLANIRMVLRTRSANGIRGLSRIFRSMDNSGDLKLDRAEFADGLLDYGLKLTPAQVSAVFDVFDRDHNGVIDFTEFLTAIRGEMSERRLELVAQAFKILDADHSGVINLKDIRQRYNAKFHPAVLAGEKTEDQVLREFLDGFDAHKKDGEVTADEFVEYYRDISSSIDTDEYFEVMMTNAWGLNSAEEKHHVSGYTGHVTLIKERFGESHAESLYNVKRDRVLNADTFDLPPPEFPRAPARHISGYSGYQPVHRMAAQPKPPLDLSRPAPVNEWMSGYQARLKERNERA